MLSQLPLEKIKNIIIAWGATLVSVCFLLIFFKIFTPEYFDKPSVVPYPEGSFTEFVGSCFVGPIWEEALFRFVPFEIFRRLLSKEKFDDITLPLLLLTSIVFGWMHGSVLNIFVQGVGGFFFGWVYLKNNHSYISAVATHSLWNFMVGVGLPLFFKLI